MVNYRICVIGGWCGNRMVMVAEHLTDVLARAGLPCQVSTHSVWENYSRPPAADLVLQLLPAFTAEETGCPVISIRPMIADLYHTETIRRVTDHVQASHPLALIPAAQV